MKRLHNFEIQRQELLKELVHTERTHLKKLQIMKHVRMIALYSVSVFTTTPPPPPPLSLSLSLSLCRFTKTLSAEQNILSLQQAEQLFPSLEELVVMHSKRVDYHY